MNNLPNNYEKVKNALPIRKYAQAVLTLAPKQIGGKPTYICPVCNSGGHNSPNSTSAFSFYRGKYGEDRFHCHSAICNIDGDIFDLVGIMNHTEDREEQLKIAAKFANVQLEYSTPAKADNTTDTKTIFTPVREKEQQMNIENNRANEIKYQLKWQENLSKNKKAIEYLKNRGYTLEQAKQLRIGYNSQTQRLVLPFKGVDWYHIDRSINPTNDVRYIKPKHDILGEQPLYNPTALEQDVCIIVEGVFDAMALLTLGFSNVIALCGCSNQTQLIDRLLAASRKPYVVIFLDMDEQGIQAAKTLKSKLDNIKIESKIITLQDLEIYKIKGKDADEMRLNDAEALKHALNTICKKCLLEVTEKQEEIKEKALAALNIYGYENIFTQFYSPYYKEKRVRTSFNIFDGVLNGGLPVGLTIIGALSSLGKTTLCLQIADCIAADGRPVLFVTIEQSQKELLAKSLSRISYQSEKENLTGYDVLTRDRQEYNKQKWDSLLMAMNEYTGKIGKKMHIMEGRKQPTVDDIKAAAQVIAYQDGETPVIFIDYLQLLAGSNANATDKQNMDNDVSALRQLARDLETPIMLISSLNRASYNSKIATESFKESGSIEYSADILLGLQPASFDELDNATNKDSERKIAKMKIKEHKTSNKREIELVVLKNRNGIIPKNSLKFNFLPAYSYWKEIKPQLQQEKVISC